MQITTLVPAYKPQYLPELLASLRQQTRPARQIIVSDDSPNGEFRAALFSDALAPLRAGLDIEFHEGPRQGGYANMMHLVRLWAGRSELLHLMLDDDVAYPEFYERHLVAHASAQLSCSISRRWTANEQGHPISGQAVPPGVANSAHRLVSLDAGVVFMTTAAECRNWFGEFSNTVFRAETAPLLLKPDFGGVSYAGLWDLGAFMAASLQAPVGYVQDYLGFFRIGGTSNTSKFFGPYMKAAHLGYGALAMGGQRIGMYTPAQARRAYGLLAGAMVQRYGGQEDMQPFIALLPAMAAGDELAEASFLEVWQAYLRQNGF
jgi:Glycosyl transferase family 2